jgi:uncharacterized membrane protein YfcA
LITFPLLMAVGLSSVTANVTNTVALSPGHFGATLAQLRDLKSQKKRLLLYVPAALIGGTVGGLLLLHTGERIFNGLIPYLILFASLLLAVGEPLRKWLNRDGSAKKAIAILEIAGIPAVMLAAVYGGYFGAGLSVIFLAVLGVLLNESLTKLNALKQVLSLSANMAAAVFFLFSGNVHWGAALMMAICALGGGMAGGKLAGKISPTALRWTVVTIGLIVAVVYFLK